MTSLTTHKDIFSKLKAPFASKDIEWSLVNVTKEKNRGRALPSVKFKAVVDRLDEVLGETNWKNEYAPGLAGGVVCRLSLRVGGEWVCKENGTTKAEDVQDGLADAFKQAATLWGLGRYLHTYEAIQVEAHPTTGEFQAPALPDEFLSAEELEEKARLGQTQSPAVAGAATAVSAMQPASTPENGVKNKGDEAEASTPPTAASASESAAGAEPASSKQSTGAQAEADAVQAPSSTSEPASPAADDNAEQIANTNIVRPTDLPEAQLKRIKQLEERIEKNVPTEVIRQYVEGPKGVETMVESARNYILALLAQKDRAAQSAEQAA